MKKHIILPALMSALLCASACSDGEEQDLVAAVSSDSEEVSVVFVAGMQGNGLQKTALAANGTTINLVGTETIRVVADNGDHSSFDIKNTTAAASTFNGKVPKPVLDASNNFVAMYPEGKFIDNEYKMSIPTTQTAALDNFDPQANLLIATTTKDAMEFVLQNVCSFAKVTVSAPVEWIRLSANENIAGDVSVKTDGTCEGGSSNTIELMPADGNTIAPGTYYIAVKPGKVTGLKIESSAFFEAVTTSTGNFEFVRAGYHGATFKKVNPKMTSEQFAIYLSGAVLADGEVVEVELEDYDLYTVWSALQNNSSKKVNLKLPESVTSIGEFAFQFCVNLAYIELPSGITSIGNYAFNGCTNLALETLPSGITSIGSNAFNGCTNLRLTELPSGITSIGSNACEFCENLEDLAILSTPSFGSNVFDNCSDDLNVYVNSETYSKYHNQYPMMAAPANYVANLADLSSCDADEIFLDLTTYDDPDAVKSALQSTDKKVTLKLPSDVTAIDAEAFKDCASLKEIILPEGLLTIGASAFQGTGLSEITVPASVTKLGTSCLDADNLKDITFLGTDFKLPVYSPLQYRLYYNDIQVKTYTTVFKDLDREKYEREYGGYISGVRYYKVYYDPEKDDNTAIERTVHISKDVDQSIIEDLSWSYITIDYID